MTKLFASIINILVLACLKPRNNVNNPYYIKQKTTTLIKRWWYALILKPLTPNEQLLFSEPE